ncbi:MAG: GIY-YIG nuclease family protein [Nitrososphaerota archaeon]|nr:GIY-YIG nuclease family protein [Nitrososphaerota archaeon]
MVKGFYTLLIRITKTFSRQIGSLGRVSFEKGNYVYVGSARSSLFPRLSRHFAKQKPLHWHIDYLTTSKFSSIKVALYAATKRKGIECLLSAKLAALSFCKAISRFGSTDCKRGCIAHLYLLKSTQNLAINSIIRSYACLGLKPLVYRV